MLRARPLDRLGDQRAGAKLLEYRTQQKGPPSDLTIVLIGDCVDALGAEIAVRRRKIEIEIYGFRYVRSLPLSALLRSDGAPNNQALNIAGAFVYLTNPHVAPVALDREVAEIAIAAKGLDRTRTDALGHFG